MRRLLKSMLMLAAILATVDSVKAQVVETQPQRLEIEAFSALTGARRLDPAQVESGEEVIILPSRIPVIGIGDALGDSFIGLEADKGVADTFITIASGFGNSQEVTLNSGTVYVDSDLRAVVGGRHGGGGRYTLEAPQIQFIGDDMIELPADANTPEANEVVASFELGGVQIRVTLVCHAQNLTPCADEAEIRRLIGGLEVLGRGTMQ